MERFCSVQPNTGSDSITGNIESKFLRSHLTFFTIRYETSMHAKIKTLQKLITFHQMNEIVILKPLNSISQLCPHCEAKIKYEPAKKLNLL